MTSLFKIMTIASALGAVTFAAVPASALSASHVETASPLIQVASGGWSSRVSGKRQTYDYGYGYEGQGYGWNRGPARYGSEEQGWGDGYDGGYGFDEGAY